MISTQFSFAITINGRQARNSDDLENFSKQEIWSTLENFLGVNLQLRTEVANLTGVVNDRNAEIGTLRGELAELADIKRQLLAVIQENATLNDKISSLVKENANLNEKYSTHESQLIILKEEMAFVKDIIMPIYKQMEQELHERHNT
jgi:predicted nuclease with TOPRIM domain